MADQRARVVETAYRLISEGRFDDAAEHFAEDATWRGSHEIGEAAPWCRNRDQILETFRGLYERFGDRLRPEQVEEEAGRVLVRWPDHPEGGPLYHVITVRDGRILFIHDFRDRDDALVALGLIPQPS